MEIVALSAFVTHTRPSGARARLRGARPTLVSASFARVTASRTVTLSVSGLTSQTRSLPVARSSKMMLDETAGFFVVSGACTAWKKVLVTILPVSSVAVMTTV